MKRQFVIMMVCLSAITGTAWSEDITIEIGPYEGSIFLSPVGDVFCAWKDLARGDYTPHLYVWRLSRGVQDIGDILDKIRHHVSEVTVPTVIFGGGYATWQRIIKDSALHPPVVRDPAGALHELPFSGYTYSINGSGELVGSEEKNFVYSAFAWSLLGGLSMPPYAGADYSFGCSVNESGDIAGIAQTGDDTHTVIWMKDGTQLDLGSGGTANLYNSPLLNDADTSLFLGTDESKNPKLLYRQSNGVVHDLGNKADNSNGRYILRLNDAGLAVWNRVTEAGNRQAVAWDPVNGLMEITPDEAGDAYVTDLNEAGQVVGTWKGKAFVWDQTNGLHILTENNGVQYVRIDSLGRIAWCQYGYVIYLRQPDGSVETLSTLDSNYNEYAPIVALNDLGQVAWLGKNDEGTPTVYLRGPVDTLTDTDGDARSDAIEGKGDDKAASRDTDGDTTPDYLDLDSDNDGLPDAYDPTAYDMDNPTPLPLATTPLILALAATMVWRRKKLPVAS